MASRRAVGGYGMRSTNSMTKISSSTPRLKKYKRAANQGTIQKRYNDTSSLSQPIL